MIAKYISTLNWLPSYYRGVLKRLQNPVKPTYILFCICDHFEPYLAGASKKSARRRIKKWVDEYPKIADRYKDVFGKAFKYSFFYPQEQYLKEDIDQLAKLCHAGYGEVEIHLHHDKDTSANLRRTLLDFKKRLYEVHGLLAKDSITGEISYGFIHGNWALDNSRPDGRWCGVDDEITILQETGCYADFTMPSAPDFTQTRIVNSIYYAVDDPLKPKSHDSGVECIFGKGERRGLLMVQGPLSLSWARPKWKVIPRIENGGLMGSNPPSEKRIRNWTKQKVHVNGNRQCAFVKLYTHGADDANSVMLFNESGLNDLFEGIANVLASEGIAPVFCSAREMVNVIWDLLQGKYFSESSLHSRYRKDG